MKFKYFNIIKALIHNPNIDLDIIKFARTTGLKIGELNITLLQMGQKKYLVRRSSLSLRVKPSDFALEEYEKHKVTNAIILAASEGKSFVPLTYSKPRGLIKINNEPIVERQINFLKAKGINNITLVSGHLKSQYNYLKEKYGINIIENDDYKLGSLTSLFAARYLLDNTYILSSSAYVKENIFNEYEAKSFLTYSDSTEFHNFSLKIDEKDRIVSIANNTGKRVLEELIYFDRETSKQLLSFLENTADIRGKYQNIIKNHISEIKLYGNKITKDMMLNVKSLYQLRALDAKYLITSHDKCLSLLSNILECSEDKIVNIVSTKNGLTNKSFSFNYEDDRYMFRLPGEGSDLFINRANEYNSYLNIKDLKISDVIVYFNPSTGYKVSKYLEGYRPCNPYDKTDTKNAMKIIRQLHDANIQVEHEFNFKERILYHEKLAKENNGVFYYDYYNLKPEILDIYNILNNLNSARCLCHVDCLADNVLTNGEEYKLIDWEYSALADPISDIAQYISFVKHSEEEVNEIIEIYLGREAEYDELLRLYGYIALVGYFWATWGIYKISIGCDIGKYGDNLYDYAREYIPKFYELYNK